MLPEPLPPTGSVNAKILTTLQIRTRSARRALASRGMLEAVTWSFISAEHAKLFGGGSDKLKLVNPIAADMSDMRPSLLPGLIRAAQANADRGRTYVLVGDGAYMMMNSDIFSAALSGTDMTVVVCDNEGFAVIERRFNLSRNSLTRTLSYLREQGWVMPNPGHGHPLRPEYILTESGAAERIVDSISEAAKTGKIGDGKIWVSDLDSILRIRTGETGDTAL